MLKVELVDLPEKVARLPQYAQLRFVIKREWLQKGYNVEWSHDRLCYKDTGKTVEGVPAVPKPPEVIARQRAYEQRRKANKKRVRMAKRSLRRATKHFGFSTDFLKES